MGEEKFRTYSDTEVAFADFTARWKASLGTIASMIGGLLFTIASINAARAKSHDGLTFPLLFKLILLALLIIIGVCLAKRKRS